MENNTRLETELPNKMASLDLLEGKNNSHMEDEETPHTSLRSLRKRTTHLTSPVSNRRVIMKPRKKQFKISMSEDEIKKYYLDRKVKTPTQTLETIFEEPKCANSGTTILIGSKKIKRSLTFHVGPVNTKDKIKKRRMRIKRLLGTKNFLNRKKLSMQTFIQNFQSLDSDEPPNLCVPSSDETIEES